MAGEAGERDFWVAHKRYLQSLSSFEGLTGLTVFGCFWIPSYWSLLILEFLDAIDFLGNRTQLNSAYAQVEIDLVKLEAQMISEGDLDEETERSENYTPSESIKETESLGRSGVSVLGTLSTNEAFFQWFLHKTGHCSTDAAMSLRYYDLLKVKPSASEAEIKKAYYKEWKSDGFFFDQNDFDKAKATETWTVKTGW